MPKEPVLYWHLPDPCPIPDSSNCQTAQHAHAHYTFLQESWAAVGLQACGAGAKHQAPTSSPVGRGDTFLLDWKFYPEAAAANWPYQSPSGLVSLWSQASPATRAARCPLSRWGHSYTVEIIYATFTSRHLTNNMLSPCCFSS